MQAGQLFQVPLHATTPHHNTTRCVRTEAHVKVTCEWPLPSPFLRSQVLGCDIAAGYR